MAGLSPFAGLFAGFVPSCIGRGAARVNPALPGPARLAVGAADLLDGTGALLTVQTAATTASCAFSGVSMVSALPGVLGTGVVTVTGSVAVSLVDGSTLAGSTGMILGVVPSSATLGQIFTWNMPAANGIVWVGTGAGAPTVTLGKS